MKTLLIDAPLFRDIYYQRGMRDAMMCNPFYVMLPRFVRAVMSPLQHPHPTEILRIELS